MHSVSPRGQTSRTGEIMPKDTHRSVAVWPDTISVGNVVGKNESSDTHASEAAAQAVCNLLEKFGFGGDQKVYPLSTRVEEIEP